MPTPHPKRRWFRITGKRFFIGVGVLFGAALLFLVEEHVRGRMMLNRWMTEMRAKGERFTLQEIVPPPPAPEDNAASVVSGVILGGAVVPQQIPAAMQLVAPGKAVAVIRQESWLLASGRSGAKAIFFTTNAAALRSNPGRPGRAASTNTNNPATYSVLGRADLAADVNGASNALAALRDALRRPGLDFGLDYSQGFWLRLPHLQQLRAQAQWLRAGSLHSLLETNLDSSLENLRALAALTQLQTNGVLLIEQLVRIATVQIGVGAVWEALQAEGWTDAQLAQMQKAWHEENSSAALLRALEMERAFSFVGIDRFSERDFDLLGLGAGFPGGGPAPALPTGMEGFADAMEKLVQQAAVACGQHVLLPTWRFAWKDHAKLYLAQQSQPAIEAARRQAAHPGWLTNKMVRIPGEASVRDVTTQLDIELQIFSWYDRCRYLMALLMGRSGNHSVAKAVNAETARALAETAIAIRRWELRHGQPPATLGLLMPEILPQVPRDPFDGQPLRYRANTNGTFTLYSVGENGTDDGGNATPERPKETPQFLNGKDLVWPVRATAEEIRAFEEKKPGK